MTTVSPPMVVHPRSRYLALAVGASLVHLLLMIPGYSEGGRFEVGPWAVVLAISLVVSLLVFGFVVPGGGAVSAVAVGVGAVLSVLVFWAGLTLPLAAASAYMGWRARQRGERPGLATSALACAALAAVAVVAVILADYLGIAQPD